jgi:hypothetical protein
MNPIAASKVAADESPRVVGSCATCGAAHRTLDDRDSNVLIEQAQCTGAEMPNLNLADRDQR